MGFWTNRALYRMHQHLFQGSPALPTQFNAALVTSAVVPTVDSTVFSALTEIAEGNGYTSGGLAVTRDATGFPTVTEDTANNLASSLIKDLVWTASGGNLPASGSGARYLVLLDNNATVADREIWWFADLSSDRTVSDTQELRLEDGLIRSLQPA